MVSYAHEEAAAVVVVGRPAVVVVVRAGRPRAKDLLLQGFLIGNAATPTWPMPPHEKCSVLPPSLSDFSLCKQR